MHLVRLHRTRKIHLCGLFFWFLSNRIGSAALVFGPLIAGARFAKGGCTDDLAVTLLSA